MANIKINTGRFYVIEWCTGRFYVLIVFHGKVLRNSFTIHFEFKRSDGVNRGGEDGPLRGHGWRRDWKIVKNLRRAAKRSVFDFCWGDQTDGDGQTARLANLCLAKLAFQTSAHLKNCAHSLRKSILTRCFDHPADPFNENRNLANKSKSKKWGTHQGYLRTGWFYLAAGPWRPWSHGGLNVGGHSPFHGK